MSSAQERSAVGRRWIHALGMTAITPRAASAPLLRAPLREAEVLGHIRATATLILVLHGRTAWFEFEWKAHPRMLRHACGYALAAKGHDTRAIQQYPGHSSITNTAVYTALAPNRFKDFWRD
jgi:integrase